MIRLTAPQIEALIACYTACEAGEWPFEDVSEEVAKRAVRKLRDLGPAEGAAFDRALAVHDSLAKIIAAYDDDDAPDYDDRMEAAIAEGRAALESSQ